MGRILDTRACPHCKQALEKPTPRSCPRCGGSLQQRYMRFGCLSSAPLALLAAGLAWALSWTLARVALG